MADSRADSRDYARELALGAAGKRLTRNEAVSCVAKQARKVSDKVIDKFPETSRGTRLLGYPVFGERFRARARARGQSDKFRAQCPGGAGKPAALKNLSRVTVRVF